MARPSGTGALVLLLVALAGGAGLASAAARPVAFGHDDTAPLMTSTSSAPAAGEASELNGMMQCLMGCFTQVFGCSFGCMGKGPDLPLCIISCDQKSVVCMIRCGLAPSPPKPAPPKPTPPSPKPPSPKPPTPAPPYTPPYAVAARKTETAA